MKLRSDKQLLTLIRRTARKRGTKSRGAKSLSAAQFERATGVNASVIKKRFGTWNNAVRAAGLKANEARRHQYDDPLVEIYRRCRVAGKGMGDGGRGMSGRRKSGVRNLKSKIHSPTSNILLGVQTAEKIVMFEPRYESGVVLLFGVLAERLGFRVLQVRKDYPDMFAWRRLPGTDRWEQVSCEFEVRSRDFRLHKHDPRLCDLIICWQHNWPACPLEVIELRKLVGNQAIRLRRTRG